MRFLLLIMLATLTACSVDRWEGITFPSDQQFARMAFKRLSNHGDMEAVLVDGQRFEDWRFYVASTTDNVIDNEPDTVVIGLEDGSGIDYRVQLADGAPLAARISVGTMGRASGQVTGVERDLSEGVIKADLALDSWRTAE